MARDKIIVESNTAEGKHRLCWFLAEEGETGAAVGEGKYTRQQLDAAIAAGETNEVEMAAAAVAAEAERPDGHDTFGFFWYSASAAQKARTNVNRAVRVAVEQAAANLLNAPWPDWATKAAAAGWKPPKGWRPE